MNDPAAARGSPGQAHPMVGLDYRVRIVGHAIIVVILASIFYERGVPGPFWGALLAQGFVWPHLAYAHARGSRDSRRAERVNLALDAFFSGCWAAQAAWSLWPTVTILTALLVGILSVAGLRFTLLAGGAVVVGSLVMGSLTGFRFQPEASALTTALSIGGTLLYAGVFGVTTHRQARRLVQSGRTIEEQSREIAEALARQRATGAILRALSASPTDVQPVMDVIAQDAARLCQADDCVIFRLEGETLQPTATHAPAGGPPAVFPVLPLTRGSVAGRCVVDRAPVHVRDLAAEPDSEYPVGKAHQPRLGLRTVLAAPLLREGRAVGAILLRRREVRSFTPQEVELLELFADQAAIAIHTAGLFAELGERSRELGRSLDEVQALAEVTHAMVGSLDLDKVLDTVLRHAVRLSGSDAGMIVQYSPATRSFVDMAAQDLSPAFLAAMRATRVDVQEGVLRRAHETGQPFQVPDVAAAERFVVRDITLREGFRSLLAAPIPGDNVNRGVVVFRRAAGRFAPREVDLLAALAGQSKVAIDNARLFQQVESQRLALEQVSLNLEQLYGLSTALQEPLSLREQLHRVLEAASQMGILDRIYVWAVSDQADRLVNLAGAGFAADEWKDFEGTEIPLEEAGVMYQAYREGRALLYTEDEPVPAELRLRPPWSELKAIRTRSLLVVPMIARGVTVGVLAGDNKPSRRPILPHTVTLVQTFASHAAVAIANARLFQALEDKGRQLEAANRAKSQFLANVSHELRTPMNAILGYTELVLDGTYGEVPEKIRGVLERVDRSGRHLLELINDVLDLSKIEAGQLGLNVADYSMREVVQNVFLAAEPLAAEKALDLQVSLPRDLPGGRGDERRLTQVMLNLVGNAVKFTEVGRVTITVAADGPDFRVAVSDTGPGIAPADQQKIFEEFKQVDDSSTKTKGGTGLGLAIARRIVEMHGGRLWVESAPGQGATFTFTVPIRLERRRASVPVADERRRNPA